MSPARWIAGESAPDFFNSMVEVDLLESTDVNDLLTALRQIETQLGRPSRRPKNASRPVDLDILYAGNLALHTPTLTLPHPRLHQRRFVLAPLVNVRPGLDPSRSAVFGRNAVAGTE